MPSRTSSTVMSVGLPAWLRWITRPSEGVMSSSLEVTSLASSSAFISESPVLDVVGLGGAGPDHGHDRFGRTHHGHELDRTVMDASVTDARADDADAVRRRPPVALAGRGVRDLDYVHNPRVSPGGRVSNQNQQHDAQQDTVEQDPAQHAAVGMDGFIY